MKFVLLIMTLTDPTMNVQLNRFPPSFETAAECSSVGKEVAAWTEEAIGYMCVRWPTPFDDFVRKEFHSN